MIPKKIYTYWEGSKYPYIDYCLESIRKMGGVEVVVLDPTTAPHFVEGSGLNCNWSRLTNISQKVDCIRLGVLYNHGGLWCDADTVMIRPCGELFERYSKCDFVGLKWSKNKKVLNGYFMAMPGSLVLKNSIEIVNRKLSKGLNYYSGNGGCELGEDVLSEAVPGFSEAGSTENSVSFMPIETFLPVEFPFDCNLWNTPNSIERFVQPHTIAIGLNNSQYSTEWRRRPVSSHAAGDTLISSIFRPIQIDSIKRVAVIFDLSHGHEFVDSSLKSIYNYVNKIFVKSTSEANGQALKTVSEWRDKFDNHNKIEFNIGKESFSGYDILLRVRSCEVWGGKALLEIINNSIGSVESSSFFNRVEYIKSPFYRIKSKVTGDPESLIHSFRYVRESSAEACELICKLHKISNADHWTNTVWKRIPGLSNHAFSADTVSVDDLPAAVKDNFFVKNLLSQNKKEIAAMKFKSQVKRHFVPVEKPVEPKKVKIEPKTFSGKLAIMTVVDKNYKDFVPMFTRCAKSAVPDAGILVIERSDSDGYMPGGRVSAAMRFLVEPEGIEKYDYVLITDVDIMLSKENYSIIDQHMNSLEKDGTWCYENWIFEERSSAEPRMLGVHFVTKDWWMLTKSARSAELELLKTKNASESDYDEWMIGRIVVKSGLPLPPRRGAKLWRHHGVHIGDWRMSVERRRNLRMPDVFEKIAIRAMLDDAEFMSLTEEASKSILYLPRVIKAWKQALM